MKRGQSKREAGSCTMASVGMVLVTVGTGCASMEMGCRKKRSLNVFATSPLWLSDVEFSNQEYGINPERNGISIKPYMRSSQSICLFPGESFLSSERSSITKMNKKDHFISVIRKRGGMCEIN
jgi:hypothetical protein